LTTRVGSCRVGRRSDAEATSTAQPTTDAASANASRRLRRGIGTERGRRRAAKTGGARSPGFLRKRRILVRKSALSTPAVFVTPVTRCAGAQPEPAARAVNPRSVAGATGLEPALYPPGDAPCDRIRQGADRSTMTLDMPSIWAVCLRASSIGWSSPGSSSGRPDDLDVVARISWRGGASPRSPGMRSSRG
jgi:hypothetical protein